MVRKNPPMDRILNQKNPVHTLISYIRGAQPHPYHVPLSPGKKKYDMPVLTPLQIHFNIIPPSNPGSIKQSIPFRFPSKILYLFHISRACYSHRQIHLPWFRHTNNAWWRVQTMKLLIMQHHTHYNTECPRKPDCFFKFKNQFARYAALPYRQSSCTVLFGV
jgi:hypothetical protein